MIQSGPTLILASASTARRAVLAAIHQEDFMRAAFGDEVFDDPHDLA